MAWFIVKNEENKYNIWSSELGDYLLDLWLSKEMIKIEYVNGRLERYRKEVEKDFEHLIKNPLLSFEERKGELCFVRSEDDENA